MMCPRRPYRPQQTGIKFLDLLNFVIIFLELRTQLHLQKQASNDDLLREIQKDTDAIIERLNKIGGKQND